jgi:hypothetical protein
MLTLHGSNVLLFKDLSGKIEDFVTFAVCVYGKHKLKYIPKINFTQELSIGMPCEEFIISGGQVCGGKREKTKENVKREPGS